MSASTPKPPRRPRSLTDMVAALPPDVTQSEIVQVPFVPPERPALVPFNVYMADADRTRLKQMALDTGESMQQLVREGISRMLVARGHPPLVPATANVPTGMRRKSIED